MASQNKSPFGLIMIVTLVVVALAVALVIINNSMESDVGTSFDEAPSIEGQPVMGEEDAPVTVVEFGDFKCPSCKAWGENIYPQFVKDYVETGKVKFAYVNVLFHGNESKLASLAAESVYKQNPEIYWDFHKEIYKEQPASHDTAWVTEEKLLEIANNYSEIDTEQLQNDLENNTDINQVNKDTELVTKYEVELTPTIMVDNVVIEDPFDYEAIEEAIEIALEDN
ncbi:Protein-disulfide isomerase [Oceanobacillus limi]|uniref:Protein-disulfide isomerase n=1 Tax=Oceanobacillus limi TaxID=930131 RepID=A0A1I0FH38_9BACI|nr:thioredoxin domain-containing protein [Oceanobacillus limi]SET57539.1 Protein-disulfide isomerase [Oceanobacillus limi]